MNRLFAPAPLARIGWLRLLAYGFVPVDLLVTTPWVAEHGSVPAALYLPLRIGRLLSLPTPGPWVHVLQWLLVAGSLGCAVAAARDRPARLGGALVAVSYLQWMVVAMSYGKVDHDHLALIVALWVLPSAGAVAGRWRSRDSSARSGWALKCIQIAVVFTYFLSMVTKVRSGGWSYTSWPDSAILEWAIIRRPHWVGDLLVGHPGVLHVMQWFAYLAETSSLVVLWLRGRALLCAALFWLGFHVFTAVILYIHFAPTLVCWLAFAPLERLGPWWREVRARREH